MKIEKTQKNDRAKAFISEVGKTRYNESFTQLIFNLIAWSQLEQIRFLATIYMKRY